MSPAQIRALFEQRQNAATELRSLYAAAADRDLSAEERSVEDRLNGTITDLASRIAGGLSALEADAAADEARARFEALESRNAGGGADTGAESVADVDARSIQEMIAAGSAKTMREFGLERRDLTVGTGSAGGNLRPTTLFGSIYTAMRESASMVYDGGANARVIVTATGENITFPTVSTFSSAGLVAEGAAISESDPAISLVTLKAYKFGKISQISAELEQDAPIIDSFVTQEAGVALGRAANSYFVTGTGSSQPQGITQTTNANNKTAAGAAAITADELMDVQHGIPSSYRAGARWVMKDSTVKLIRKLKDSNGQYLWQPGLAAGHPDVLLGSPIVLDDSMAAATTGNVSVVYGDFNKGLLVRFVGAVRAERSTDYAFNVDLVTWRFLVRCDSAIIDHTAIVKLTQA